jgi:hypothetical protein
VQVAADVKSVRAMLEPIPRMAAAEPTLHPTRGSYPVVVTESFSGRRGRVTGRSAQE